MNLRVRIKRKGKWVFLFLLFRVNSVQNLSTISVALGKERTRNELLPYIMDLMDDEEEILIVLAQSLNGQFLDHVGGPLFAPHLFKPLERLCEVEESTIRDKVSEGFANQTNYRLWRASKTFSHWSMWRTWSSKLSRWLRDWWTERPTPVSLQQSICSQWSTLT